MIYPKSLKAGNIIGVTAPSDGSDKEIDFVRLDSAINQFNELAYEILETPNVRTSEKGRSSSKEVRAKELMSLYENQEVDGIISAGGGDFLAEILPLLDFDKIKANPKWYLGYSDNTGITFTLTTNLDIATLYGDNFSSFGMVPWHKSLENSLKILQGQEVVHESFNKFQDGFRDRETGLEGFLLNGQVKWKNIYGGDPKSNIIKAQGRALGGCLDVLLNLVGTRFDKTKEFLEKYKDDGFIWYLESYNLGSEALIKGLLQLREAGWFKYAKAFVFGRPAMFDSYTDTNYEQAVLSVLEEVGAPIILEADIGHKGPQFTMINGALAKLYSQDGKGKIEFERR